MKQSLMIPRFHKHTESRTIDRTEMIEVTCALHCHYCFSFVFSLLTSWQGGMNSWILYKPSPGYIQGWDVKFQTSQDFFIKVKTKTAGQPHSALGMICLFTSSQTFSCCCLPVLDDQVLSLESTVPSLIPHQEKPAKSPT